MKIRRSPHLLRPAFATAMAALTYVTVPAHADIYVGLAAPASGREQKTGSAMHMAAEQAIADLNAQGGVLGQRVALVTADDLCSDAGAIAAANGFVEKSVKLVVGHPCARAALAAAQIYGTAGLMFIATATRHPALTDKRAGKTIFRLSGRDDEQAPTAAAWLLAQADTGPIAIVHDKTSYSRGLAAGVSAALVGKGQPAPLALPITAGENDYEAVIAKLKDAKPRALFFAGYPAEAGIIVSAVRSAGLTMPVLGSDSLATQEFTAQRASRDQSMAVLARYRPASGDTPQSERSAATRIAATTLSPPALASAQYTREAIQAWAAATISAASASADAVAPLLAAQPATPQTSAVLFNEKGDARVASFYAVRWNGKNWVATN